jgi:hypothetical protein
VFEEVVAPGAPIGMVVTGDALRVVTSEVANGDDDARFIRRYVFGHGFKTEALPCPDDTGSFLAYDGDALFLSQRWEQRILELAPDGSVVRAIAVPRPVCGMVIVDGRFFLVTSAGRGEPLDHRLLRLDARGAEPVSVELARFDFDARSLAWDGTKLSLCAPSRRVVRRERGPRPRKLTHALQLSASPDLQRRGDVGMAFPATRNAPKAPSPATLRRNMLAPPARLRRISRIDVDYPASSICCFLANQPPKQSESRI